MSVKFLTALNRLFQEATADLKRIGETYPCTVSALPRLLKPNLTIRQASLIQDISRIRKDQIASMRGYSCEVCQVGGYGTVLHLAHATYEHGESAAVPDSVLYLLCPACHKFSHEFALKHKGDWKADSFDILGAMRLSVLLYRHRANSALLKKFESRFNVRFETPEATMCISAIWEVTSVADIAMANAIFADLSKSGRGGKRLGAGRPRRKWRKFAPFVTCQN